MSLFAVKVINRCLDPMDKRSKWLIEECVQRNIKLYGKWRFFVEKFYRPRLVQQCGSGILLLALAVSQAIAQDKAPANQPDWVDWSEFDGGAALDFPPPGDLEQLMAEPTLPPPTAKQRQISSSDANPKPFSGPEPFSDLEPFANDGFGPIALPMKKPVKQPMEPVKQPVELGSYNDGSITGYAPAGEPVELMDQQDLPVAKTMTAKDGRYGFKNINVGGMDADPKAYRVYMPKKRCHSVPIELSQKKPYSYQGKFECNKGRKGAAKKSVNTAVVKPTYRKEITAQPNRKKNTLPTRNGKMTHTASNGSRYEVRQSPRRRGGAYGNGPLRQYGYKTRSRQTMRYGYGQSSYGYGYNPSNYGYSPRNYGYGQQPAYGYQPRNYGYRQFSYGYGYRPNNYGYGSYRNGYGGYPMMRPSPWGGGGYYPQPYPMMYPPMPWMNNGASICGPHGNMVKLATADNNASKATSAKSGGGAKQSGNSNKPAAQSLSKKCAPNYYGGYPYYGGTGFGGYPAPIYVIYPQGIGANGAANNQSSNASKSASNSQATANPTQTQVFNPTFNPTFNPVVKVQANPVNLNSNSSANTNKSSNNNGLNNKSSNSNSNSNGIRNTNTVGPRPAPKPAPRPAPKPAPKPAPLSSIFKKSNSLFNSFPKASIGSVFSASKPSPAPIKSFFSAPKPSPAPIKSFFSAPKPSPAPIKSVFSSPKKSSPSLFSSFSSKLGGLF